jgi:hypothetical protein
MRTKAEVIKLKTSDAIRDKRKRMQLDSGRQIIVDASKKEERIQIIEPEGEISMTVRMTGDGPVITVRGAHLELKSAESITLEAKDIRIRAEQSASLKSDVDMDIASAKRLDIQSDDEIRLDGKMIHLN